MPFWAWGENVLVPTSFPSFPLIKRYDVTPANQTFFSQITPNISFQERFEEISAFSLRWGCLQWLILHFSIIHSFLDKLSVTVTKLSEILHFLLLWHHPMQVLRAKTYTTGQLRIKTLFQNNNIRDSFHAFPFIFSKLFIKSSKLNLWGVETYKIHVTPSVQFSTVRLKEWKLVAPFCSRR